MKSMLRLTVLTRSNLFSLKTYYGFNLLVGFSKRGFARFLKERKDKT